MWLEARRAGLGWVGEGYVFAMRGRSAGVTQIRAARRWRQVPAGVGGVALSAVLVASSLAGVGCGGAGSGPSSSTRAATGPTTLSRAVAAWKRSAVSYDAVLQSCSTSLNPGRGYWPNCTSTQRRRYMLAAGRLQRLLGDSLTEANCASFRASAHASVNALTGAFRRAWLAVKSALAGAARGSSEPATGGVSAPLLLARADSATRASTSRLTELASHLQTTCAA
jgi:hypothetical protein